MRILISTLIFSCLFLFSCQKEVNFSNTSGGNGNGGSTSGDLLIKALEITVATHDTNVVTFQWDTNKRLLVYKSAGNVNGTATDIIYTISRLSDGKISKILAESSLTGGFVDSIVYIPAYLAASSRLSYVIDTEFTIVGPIIDSSAYLYNAAGMVSSREIFTDFFGSVSASGKEAYVYDANGNVTTITDYSPDGAGGYDVSSTTTSTYDSHKNAVTLAEESYIVLGAANTSKNNPVTQVTNAAGGTSYTGTFSQQQFNSFNRPTQSSLSVMPQPPGYNVKLLYYYQ
jgi:RHS Repeat